MSGGTLSDALPAPDEYAARRLLALLHAHVEDEPACRGGDLYDAA